MCTRLNATGDQDSVEIGVFANGYQDIHYDPFSIRPYLYTTQFKRGRKLDYSARLHFFDATAALNLATA